MPVEWRHASYTARGLRSRSASSARSCASSSTTSTAPKPRAPTRSITSTGRPYTVAEAEDDFNGVYQKLHRDVSEASHPTTYTTSTPRGRALDAMSVIQWIEESVPGGMASRLGQLLDVRYNIEFGAECSDQSALNLLYLLG
jgi:hypothetical protein